MPATNVDAIIAGYCELARQCDLQFAMHRQKSLRKKLKKFIDKILK